MKSYKELSNNLHEASYDNIAKSIDKLVQHPNPQSSDITSMHDKIHHAIQHGHSGESLYDRVLKNPKAHQAFKDASVA